MISDIQRLIRLRNVVQRAVSSQKMHPGGYHALYGEQGATLEALDTERLRMLDALCRPDAWKEISK